MIVDIQVHRYLCKYFRQTGEIRVILNDDATVKDLLKALEQQHGLGMVKELISDVELRRYFIVAIDGKLAKMDERIGINAREIKLIPPISGG